MLCQVTQVFQMQLSVIQFTIKMFHTGFMQVLILQSLKDRYCKYCEIIVHLLVTLQNNKIYTVHI